jgi:hypothetical protein
MTAPSTYVFETRQGNLIAAAEQGRVNKSLSVSVGHCDLIRW